MKHNNIKRIAYMGLGGRGSGLVNRFREIGMLGTQVDVVAAYDINLELARTNAGIAGIDDLPLYDDPDRMLNEVAPDAVIISSFDSMHLENFRTVQPYNIPVMIEKPIADTIESAAEIVQLARKNTAPVLVGHNMRFAPILQRAHEIIKEGRIGQIHSFRFHNNVHYGHVYFRKWMRQRKNVGSILIEKGCHDIDILHMLTGSNTSGIQGFSKRLEYGGDRPNDLCCDECPEAPSCPDSLLNVHYNVIGKSVPWELSDRRMNLCVYADEIDIFDDDICMVQLENGIHGTYVQTLYTPYSYKSRFYTLVGSLGMMDIDIDEFAGDLKVYKRYGSKHDFTQEHFYYHERGYNEDGFMLRHFHDVICGTAQPGCTVEDAYRAVAAVASATRSADEGHMINPPTLESE